MKHLFMIFYIKCRHLRPTQWTGALRFTRNFRNKQAICLPDAYCGQSVAEYGLIVGLIAVVGIGGLSALGPTVQNNLSTIVMKLMAVAIPSTSNPSLPETAAGKTLPAMADDNTMLSSMAPELMPENMLKPTSGKGMPVFSMTETPVMVTTVTPVKTAKPGKTSNPSINGKLPEQQVCFKGTGCLSIPDVDSGRSVTELVGGLGGQLTHQYATVLDQVIAQLEQEKADPTLVSEIKKLATKGHEIGSEIETYQNLCKNAQGATCTLANNKASFFGSKTSGFKSQLTKVNKLLNNPSDPHLTSIQKIIQGSSSEITNIAKGIKIQLVTDDGKSDIINTANTAKIHLNANNICATSGSSSGCTVGPAS